MRQQGPQPELIAYNARAAFDLIWQLGLQPDVITYNAIIVHALVTYIADHRRPGLGSLETCGPTTSQHAGCLLDEVCQGAAG